MDALAPKEERDRETRIDAPAPKEERDRETRIDAPAPKGAPPAAPVVRRSRHALFGGVVWEGGVGQGRSAIFQVRQDLLAVHANVCL